MRNEANPMEGESTPPRDAGPQKHPTPPSFLELPHPDEMAIRTRVHLFATLVFVSATVGAFTTGQKAPTGSGLIAFTTIFTYGTFLTGVLYGISLLASAIGRRSGK